MALPITSLFKFSPHESIWCVLVMQNHCLESPRDSLMNLQFAEGNLEAAMRKGMPNNRSAKEKFEGFLTECHRVRRSSARAPLAFCSVCTGNVCRSWTFSPPRRETPGNRNANSRGLQCRCYGSSFSCTIFGSRWTCPKTPQDLDLTQQSEIDQESDTPRLQFLFSGYLMEAKREHECIPGLGCAPRLGPPSISNVLKMMPLFRSVDMTQGR